MSLVRFLVQSIENQLSDEINGRFAMSFLRLETLESGECLPAVCDPELALVHIKPSDTFLSISQLEPFPEYGQKRTPIFSTVILPRYETIICILQSKISFTHITSTSFSVS